MSIDIEDGPQKHGVIIRPLTAIELTAGIGTGSVALLMLGLQPLILGALADENRLDASGIGSAATLEMLTLGLTTGLLASLAPPRHLRPVNTAAALALAACNGLGMTAHGTWFVMSRGGAGLAAGVMVWVTVSTLTRALRPDRMAGIFLTVQTLAQAGLASLLPLTLMARYGANGGLAALGALAAVSVLASPWLPAGLVELPRSEAGSGRLPARALLGLALVFFQMAGIVGLWVFVEQLGAGLRISARVAQLAVAASLGAQVTGSAAATLSSNRLPAMAVLLAACLANIAVIRVLGHSIDSGTYLGAILLFGFLWMFCMPFQTRLLIDLDPSRRAALLLAAVQLLGSAAGPAFTSMFAKPASLAGVLNADAALFAAAAGCILLLAGRRWLVS